MRDIENFAMNGLEGMGYRLTVQQRDFQNYTRAAIILLTFLMVFHSAVKFLRLRQLNFMPAPDSYKISRLIRAICNVIERDMAPPLIILAISIATATFHALSIVLVGMVLLLSFYLMYAYNSDNNTRLIVACGRVLMYVLTIGLFADIISADHPFADSTLPQEIELHMTNAARFRHGDQYVDEYHDDLKIYIHGPDSVRVNGTIYYNNGTIEDAHGNKIHANEHNLPRNGFRVENQCILP